MELKQRKCSDKSRRWMLSSLSILGSQPCRAAVFQKAFPSWPRSLPRSPGPGAWPESGRGFPSTRPSSRGAGPGGASRRARASQRASLGPRYADKMAAAAVDSAMEVVPALPEEASPEPAGLSCLVNLPGEVLEYILCSGSLSAADIGRVSSACRRLRELCQSSGKVWKEQFRVR